MDAVIVVALTTVILVAVAPPIVSVVLGVKLVPVITTEVPPVTGPLLGAIELRVGAAA